MAGIVFFRSAQLEILRTFYAKELGMELWLDQGECLIFRHGNLLLGFCTSEECHNQGIITLFFRSKEEIDAWHRKLSSISMGTPQENNRLHIYHFFACDPEGRTLEFQCFLHALAPHKVGTDLLAKRRSVRRFENSSVSEELLWQVFELCRTSPTSHNTQSYYYLVVRDREKIERIAALRGSSTAPLARAPVAVAICADPKKTKRPEQDSCIAAYHLILAAELFGLGTCWLAAMDRQEAKDILEIGREQCIATITPLGYPAEIPKPIKRREAREFVRFL
jgi:nitroreductase